MVSKHFTQSLTLKQARKEETKDQVQIGGVPWWSTLIKGEEERPGEGGGQKVERNRHINTCKYSNYVEQKPSGTGVRGQ